MKPITEKKLDALSKEEFGVQLNLSKEGVRIVTRDTPLVKFKAATIDEAVEGCWNKLMASIEETIKFDERFYGERMREKRSRLLSTVDEV